MRFKEDLATLGLNIDPHAKPALYLQLAQQLQTLIENGRLSVGMQLPSSRKLAQQLGVSRTATLNAYEQLMSLGLVISRPASGLYVAERLQPPPSQTISSIKPTTAHAPLSQGIFDPGPDPSLFPSQDWARSLAKVWRKPDPSLLRDIHVGGYPALRRAIAHLVNMLRGVECSEDQVVVTAGNRDALGLITQTLLKSGDTIAIEDPFYPPICHALKQLNFKLAPTPVDAEGMTLPQSPHLMAWMTPACQFPLGMSMSTQRRLQWLNLLQQSTSWLVEDDFNGEFHYHKSPQLPLYQLAANQNPALCERMIMVGSLSKLMFRTLRIGYIIATPRMAQRLIDTQKSVSPLSSVPIQPAIADFLGQRSYATYLRRMRRCYQQRRDYLYDQLTTHLSDPLRVSKPQRGMHMVASFHPTVKPHDQQIEKLLQSQGIYAPALSQHYQQGGQQGLILGFSGANEQALKKGIAQLQALLL
ncbi:MocR-like pyridoxine biosynthesis transcription factor PdxR [Magnetococcus sp. PR-3]|uniref:MocR-like pyridoxine biosynthesis transcription factor PdxR n=1 Tax=Magnetococcus sp. PR-3 TaxID=3120355 RepID=UPI002FCE28BE